MRCCRQCGSNEHQLKHLVKSWYFLSLSSWTRFAEPIALWYYTARPVTPSYAKPRLFERTIPFLGLALLVCFLEGLEGARLPALRAWLDSFLGPVPGVPLTMYLEVLITLTDGMAGQWLRAFLAETFGDVPFAATLLDSTTASTSLLIC